MNTLCQLTGFLGTYLPTYLGYLKYLVCRPSRETVLLLPTHRFYTSAANLEDLQSRLSTIILNERTHKHTTVFLRRHPE